MTWITTCAREGCDREPKVRGYCRSHYAVANKWGEFNIPPRLSTGERFWAKVEKTETCWLWLAGLSPTGYGLFAERTHKQTKAHRYAYETLVAPIPEGLVIDHLCRVRSCVNPSHLEVVTPSENSKRAQHHTGPRPHQATTCSKGHEDWAFRSDGTGKRSCRTCARERKSKRDRTAEYAARRAARRAARA